MINPIYKFLEIPFIYNLCQKMFGLGMHRLIRPIFEIVFSHSANRVLDVGCGPVLNTPKPEGMLVGVDINEAYIKEYTGGFLDKDPGLIFSPPNPLRRLGFVASADLLPFPDGTFDQVRSFGVLHHLSNDEVIKALQEMYRCLCVGGQLIILDNVWPIKTWSHPVAWIIRKLDRGRYIRHEKDLLSIFEKTCPGHWVCERYTYTYTGLELLALSHIKNK